MKKFTLLLMLLGAGLFLESCYVENEGPPGPRGFDGRDGLDGLDGQDGEEAYVFEYQFDFIADDYSRILPLPDDFTMLETDVALVYFLWSVENDGTEIWRQLPQTLITSDGLLQYNFDFTIYDVSVWLDADFPLGFLGSEYLDNWIARVVVVPAQYGRGEPVVDLTNYEEVKTHYNLRDTELDTSNYPKRPKR